MLGMCLPCLLLLMLLFETIVKEDHDARASISFAPAAAAASDDAIDALLG